MPKQEAPLNELQSYLPDHCLDDVVLYLREHKVHLTITRKRQSILGDYRHAIPGRTHRISVNGNLNKYAFLITLLHELAHLFTYEEFGRNVQSHGTEWKKAYSNILVRFLDKKIFPPDVEKALMHSIKNPAASSCGDEKLQRVLHHYDQKKEGVCLVEQLPEGARFSITGGRVFQKGMRIRKRYKCTEISTGKLYLFSAVFEVERVGPGL